MLSAWIIFVSLGLSVHLVTSNHQDQRVLLKDVKVLTLLNGQQTQARRVSSIPQLKCIGGSAKCFYVPDHVKCDNQGSDGIDIQWKCTSQLPKEYKLGKLDVLCEGYDSPEDPYILVGSCGLEYYLELTETNSHGSESIGEQMTTLSFKILIFYVLGTLILLVPLIVSISMIAFWDVKSKSVNPSATESVDEQAVKKELRQQRVNHTVSDYKTCLKCKKSFFLSSFEPDYYISTIHRRQPIDILSGYPYNACRCDHSISLFDKYEIFDPLISFNNTYTNFGYDGTNRR